ncbi:phage tail tip lysozyme [[Clostridium] fimetarium]|nr:phage tail tip lysozyme [[Clostridium] fimetarium]
MHENATIVYNHLSGEGWSTNAICAVLGNMNVESRTINPGMHQPDGGGYGLVQWDPESQYLDWAVENGYSADSLMGQVKFLLITMQPGAGCWFPYPNYKDYYMPYTNFISSNESIDYLTQVFLWSYERAGTPHTDRRINSANYWSNYFN